MKLKIEDLIIPKFDKILADALDHKYSRYTLKGGRGSSKSTFVSAAILLIMTRPENRAVNAIVFRKVANTLRDSVYAQFGFSISLLGMDALFKKTRSPMEIIYLPTGRKILFRGLDEPGKIKSLKAESGYFGIAWFEELDQFAGRGETRSVLQSTMRGGGKDAPFWTFETFNPPSSALNWANKDALEYSPERTIAESSYLDVPREWLSEQFFNDAEELKRTNPRAYACEYLGEVTGSGAGVFENAKAREITDEEIKSFDRRYFGVDFGWYPDPWAFVAAYYKPSERKLFIFDEAKANKKSNRETYEIIVSKGVGRGDLVICDAEMKSVADYREYGLYAKAAEKGPGSVAYSLKWLQALSEIIIDPKRCPNALMEFQSYEYERAKSGEIISGYPDKNNHFIDAARYALNYVWRRGGG